MSEQGPWNDYAEPASVSVGRGIMDVPRQVGLAGRYAIEGPAQVANVLTEPLRNLVINPIVSAFGGTPIQGSTADAATWAADKMGLPSPQGPNERVIGDASRLVAGAGGVAGLAGKAAPVLNGVTQRVVQSLANSPGLQAASAIGAGTAGGSVREAGGGPWAQFGASLAGGLVAPLAVSAAAGPLRSAEALAQRIFAPKDIEATLQVELNRVGVDWNSLSREAQISLANDAKKAIYTGQPLNTDALRRLADFRNIGATPTMGSVTQNPGMLTAERNLAKQQANTTFPVGPNLPQIENSNAQRVISTLQNSADSPLDSYGTGQAFTNAVGAVDRGMKATENGLYQAARDSSGRAIPLDRAAFVKQAFDNLQNSNRGGWLPGQVKGVLNQISTGKAPFTVDTIDTLKTLLAQESRATTNGNVKAAIAAVRDALENATPAPVQKMQTGSPMPIPGAVGARVAQADATASNMSEEALAAFNKARAFARSRREWQESAGFIEDALSGVPPDKFVQKHIVSAPVEELAKVKRFAANDPQLNEAVRKQLIEHIMARGRVDSDVIKFSSAGMKDALDAIGQRKLEMFFSPKEISQIRSAINVGRYMQSQPIGSAVNNSNTAAMVWGRLSDILAKGQGLPLVGPMVAAPVRNVTIGMQGRAFADVPNALIPAPQRQPVPINALLLSAAAPRSDQ